MVSQGSGLPDNGVDFDIVVYGATGYTGALVAEYLAKRYGVAGQIKWAMAGRNLRKLAQVREQLGLPGTQPLAALKDHLLERLRSPKVGLSFELERRAA